MATTYEKGMAVQAHARSVLNELMAKYLRGVDVVPVAMLRKANGADPWVSNTAGILRLDALPDEFSEDGPASYDRKRAEMAVTFCVTAWAVAQGAKFVPMQGLLGEDGVVSFGQAARRLDSEKAPKQFVSLTTARTVDDAGRLVLALAPRFRSAQTVVDYARLARQLYLIENPWRSDEVRREWAHEYYDAKYGLPVRKPRRGAEGKKPSSR